MSGFEARIAEVLLEHQLGGFVQDAIPGQMLGQCFCGHSLGEYPYAGAAAHQSAMLVPVIREEMRGAFGWISEVVMEAAQKAPAPSSTPDLASAYWDGLRTASREVSDLLVEPKLIEKAINHRINDAHTN